MNWQASDIITCDKILAAFPDEYYHADVLTLGFAWWRGRYMLPPEEHKHRIIMGHSDIPLTDDILGKYSADAWWGVNVMTPNANGFPLGITNNCNDSHLHPIYGDVDSMVEVANEPRDIKNLVYMNVSIGTYPPRQKIVDMYCDKPWVTIEAPIPTIEARKRYLRQLRNHEFVFCPRGNGIDTHRLWETLYMGSIPVVERSIVHRGWEDLPILWVDSWENITEDWLRSEAQRIKNTGWNLEKLKVGYWIDRIRNGK